MSVDFAQLKERVDILDVIERLGLELKKSGEQLRGKCVLCDSSSARSFVVTPGKNLWYCFGCNKGGDQLQLYAEVKKVSTKVGAEDLAKAIGSPEEPRPAEFGPLPYLDASHPSLSALGLPEAVGEGIGAGFAPKGTLRGYICVPLRTPQGKLVGYLGINPAHDPPFKLPSKWHM